MSTSLSVAAAAPVSRRVRAYFGPVDRTSGQPTIFDPAQAGRFDLDVPPKPWVDLRWCTSFSRRSESKIAALKTGTPPTVSSQVRTAIDATVQLEFELGQAADGDRVGLSADEPAAGDGSSSTQCERRNGSSSGSASGGQHVDFGHCP